MSSPHPQEASDLRRELRKATREAYRLWAATYDSDPNPLLALEDRELSPWLAHVRGRSVVDVGCGTGRWLRKCLQWGARPGIGIDLSFEMLARGAAKPSLRGRLLQGDCLALPLPPRLADVVVCSFVAGYVHDLGALARELARIAKPGAEVFVTEFHPESRNKGWRRTFRSGSQVIEVTTVDHPEKDVVESFAAGGLRLQQSHTAYLGEQERGFFERSGRGRLFDTARQVPALLLCHFKAGGD